MFKRQEQLSLVAGLDIGTSAVRLAAGHVRRSSDGRLELQIVGASAIASEGVQKGIVTSIEELISSVSSVLEDVERVAGVPVESVWLGVNGPYILTQDSKGVVAVAKTNGEISPEDAGRAIAAARTVPMPLNYDVLHVLPRSFSVDGQSGIKDPVGMTGMRLEVDTKLVYGMSTHIKNLTRAVYRTGIDVEDTVLSILAAGVAVATPRQRDLGVAVVNIGASSTSVAVYEEGVTLHVAVIPLGSQHVTNDIAMGLRTAIDVAERIKIEYGSAMPKLISKKEIIDLGSLGGDERDVASRQYVAQIIQARVAEIFEKVNAEFAKVGRSGLLPAGVLLTGAGAKLSGITDLGKECLRLPVSLGQAYDVTSVAGAAGDLAFTTAIGLVKWGAEMAHSHRHKSRLRSATFMLDQVRKLKSWLMP
jgi:cell division protein FtsA